MGSKDILKTLIYADIFDFPLTRGEIFAFLISDSAARRNDVCIQLVALVKQGIVQYKDGWYCLAQRKRIITIRKERSIVSKEKLQRANKIASQLAKIPTVQLVGISGGLAMSNVDEDDDIDLFIIVSAYTIWITRLCVALFLDILRVRRKRDDLFVANKICINMFVDERSLDFSREQQDLYTAHEIVQMKVLFEKNNMRERFLQANAWVSAFLPHALQKQTQKIKQSFMDPGVIAFFEPFAKAMQRWYMRKKQTTETVTDTLLAFHPVDHKKSTMSAYKHRLKRYKIL